MAKIAPINLADLDRTLRCCPFCGLRSADLVQIEEPVDSGGWVKAGWTVECDIPGCFANASTQTWATPEAAATAWNKRA